MQGIPTVVSLPVIDVRGFGDAQWYPALDAACREWGCFQIVGHGVPQVLLDGVLEAMRTFFAAPQAIKTAVERTRENAWGFYDRELTKNVRDWKEIFDFGPPASSGPMAGSSPQWPADMPEFRAVMERFFSAAEVVAARLMEGIRSNLQDAENRLGQAFASEHSSFLRLNYYPVCEAPEAHLGISHHTDAGALTVLLTDAVPGLQFLHNDAWYTVSPLPGALTINIGDIVQVWSNDRYTAPLHRVLANSTTKRYSAPFFYNPGYDTNYAPLPGVVSVQQPACYRPINWGEFRAGRAAGDYSDYGEEIQISHFRI